MYFSNRITLRTYTTTQGVNGYPISTPSDTEVWSNEKSVTRAEYYSAYSNNINVVAIFEVHAEDYNNQTHVVANDKEYTIERAYKKGEGKIELICSDKKHG